MSGVLMGWELGWRALLIVAGALPWMLLMAVVVVVSGIGVSLVMLSIVLRLGERAADRAWSRRQDEPIRRVK